MKRRALLTLMVATLGLAVSPAADQKADPIIGEWNWYTAKLVVVRPDGTAICEQFQGTWKRISNATPPTYEFNWGDQFIDKLRLIKGGKELQGEDRQHRKVSASRIERTK